MVKKPSLAPHLVPKPLWGKSAANLFERQALWKQMRAGTLEAAKHACEICAASTTPLLCHEVWDYDDESGTATLARLEIHCANCDAAVHMGRAIKHGKGSVAIAQLCKVNGILPDEAKKLFADAMAVWRKRNKKEWRIVVAESLLERYPRLAALQSLA